jgi:hypothetical protein
MYHPPVVRANQVLLETNDEKGTRDINKAKRGSTRRVLKGLISVIFVQLLNLEGYLGISINTGRAGDLKWIVRGSRDEWKFRLLSKRASLRSRGSVDGPLGDRVREKLETQRDRNSDHQPRGPAVETGGI